MIRPATLEDIHDVRRLLADFSRLVLDEDIAMDEYTGVLENMITSEVVLVSDTDGVTGVILGHYIQHPFWKKTMLQEVAWYATDNAGGSLLREFIRVGKRANADAIYLTVLESAGTRVHAAVQRLGFEGIERSYIMKI